MFEIKSGADEDNDQDGAQSNDKLSLNLACESHTVNCHEKEVEQSHQNANNFHRTLLIDEALPKDEFIRRPTFNRLHK
jgi:Na+-transporting NADH:ubiquinone oxidoreductase subunit NqrF